MSDDKRTFLTMYDYGMGGIWSLIDARAKEEITSKYPELAVIDVRPAWMSAAEYDVIASNRHIDIDDEPSGWFATLVAERKHA